MNPECVSQAGSLIRLRVLISILLVLLLIYSDYLSVKCQVCTWASWDGQTQLLSRFHQLWVELPSPPSKSLRRESFGSKMKLTSESECCDFSKGTWNIQDEVQTWGGGWRLFYFCCFCLCWYNQGGFHGERCVIYLCQSAYITTLENHIPLASLLELAEEIKYDCSTEK